MNILIKNNMKLYEILILTYFPDNIVFIVYSNVWIFEKLQSLYKINNDQ